MKKKWIMKQILTLSVKINEFTLLIFLCKTGYRTAKQV